LPDVLAELIRDEFDIAWGVFSAAEVGAPHLGDAGFAWPSSADTTPPLRYRPRSRRSLSQTGNGVL
jgi:hypothetical protein